MDFMKFFGFVLSLFLSGVLHGDNTEQTHRFVDGLLQRGMYESAILLCETEMQDAENSSEQTAAAVFYASEKVYVLSRLALTKPGPQRESVLRQIEQIEEQWKSKTDVDTANSFVDVFRFPYQLAIADLNLGELYRLEEAAGSFGMQEKKSEVFLDRSRLRLEKLLKIATNRIADRTVSASKVNELLAIQYQIEIQIARVWRILAFGFDRESPEQLDCLHRAQEIFSRLAALSGTDPILVQCRLENIACLRLLHEIDTAQKMFDQLLQRKAEFSESELVQLTAEGIRLFLAQGNIEQAILWSKVVPENPNNPQRPDFDLARLEAFLSQWKLASRSDETQSKPFLDQSLKFAEQMEQLHGPYWGRRAQILVAESTKNETTGDFGVYAQLAEDSFRREKFDDAIRYYDLATAAAERANNTAFAFRFALSVASIESRLAENDAEHDSAAWKRFRDAAKKWNEQEQASDAYLFGLRHVQRRVSRKEIPVGDLIDGLVDFTKIWPQSARKDEIARKAAELLEKESRFQEAYDICPEFEGRTKKLLDLQKLAAKGDRNEAIQQSRELWNANPQDTAIAEQYGDLLAMADEPDELQTALDFWREIEKNLNKNNSERADSENDLYWKAKETIIQLHLKLGNREQAQKLIDIIRLLHPEQARRFE